jgi:hypothetical protein
MRLLGSAQVAFVRPEKEEQSDWLVWPNDSIYWPRVVILQTDAKSFQCFQKHAKLIENWFSRSKVQLTRVWKLLTRRWNAWHWETDCVFTAGGERVKHTMYPWYRVNLKWFTKLAQHGAKYNTKCLLVHCNIQHQLLSATQCKVQHNMFIGSLQHSTPITIRNTV